MYSFGETEFSQTNDETSHKSIQSNKNINVISENKIKNDKIDKSQSKKKSDRSIAQMESTLKWEKNLFCFIFHALILAFKNKNKKP